ncbi:MAG TPA: transcriptional repressor LexA [Planctomycetota bacterium]
MRTYSEKQLESLRAAAAEVQRAVGTMNYTPKQLQLLQLIFDYQEEHGYSPTYAELAKMLDVSTITVFEHLEALEKKYAITRRRHEARSVEITAPHFLLLQYQKDKLPLSSLPIKGAIAAGAPIEAVEETNQATLLGDLFNCKPNYFALKVRGDSMIDDHIMDGDYILVEKRDTASDGEIVVALDDNNQATLKRMYHENGKIRLQPSNPAIPPIIVDRVKIQGVFKGLLRKV